jgi:hypothetical protein
MAVSGYDAYRSVILFGALNGSSPFSEAVTQTALRDVPESHI